MPLRSILESGKLSKHLKGKSWLKRIKSMVINAVARPQFGGIVLQDLPGAFWISLVYICFFFAVFVTLFIRTTTSDQNLPFISLNNGQSGVTCKPVNKQIRGDFAACYASDPAFGGTAKWETKSGFMSSKSIFSVSFSGEDISSAAYYAAMDDFALKAERLTTLSDQRPLFWNILLLTCLGFSSQDGNVKLTLSTDASFTFTSVVRIALFSSRHGACIGEANSSAPTYLGGRFEEARGSISLRIPIKKPNATSILGTTRASGDSLKFLLSQKQPEPCPRHGSWAQTVINPTMYSDYRYGYGTIEFDVRSALLAIALNLNLVGTDSLTQVRSVVSDKLGLVGFLDPYYSYPPMARFYCIDKTSDVWSSSFSEEEKQDQKNSFAASDSAVRYKYPNICFLVSTTKTATIMLYYPIFSMLDTKGNMCSCGPSGNAENVDCNRHKLYTAFLYDRNSVSGMFDQSPDSKMTALDIKRDVMVTWAIGMQQFLVESMGTISADEYTGWGWSNHDADIDFLNLFTKIFWNAYLFQSRPAFSSASSEFSANQAKAWDDICAVAKSNPSDCSNRLAAVVFRSDGVVGSNQFTNPINSFNVQVADLVPDQSKTYLERATGTPQIASSCQSPFVKIIQATRDLKLTPPLNLEESYYQCTKDFQTFMIVAVGSVYSSTNLIATLCWIGMGFVFIKITKKLDLSKATLMGKHGKEVLRDIHEEMKPVPRTNHRANARKNPRARSEAA